MEGTIFLPDRETAIGQTGNPPEGWDSKRSAEKRSQPFGPDLATGWLHANGWKQAKELSPKAEALFPGRRLPAREKSPSSVSSVPLWLTFNQIFSDRSHSAVFLLLFLSRFDEFDERDHLLFGCLPKTLIPLFLRELCPKMGFHWEILLPASDGA